MLPDGLTIALLAAIESLLSAVIADGMGGTRHRSNCELVAQGIANIASPLFGGLPATGAIARTATNIRAGARTPVAGILHAAFLLLFMLLLATGAISRSSRRRGQPGPRRVRDDSRQSLAARERALRHRHARCGCRDNGGSDEPLHPTVRTSNFC